MAGVAVAVGGFIATYGAAIATVASVGLSIAMMLIPKPPIESEGPRLGENKVTTSTYGRAIPRLWARMRVGGNIIWSTEIEEERNVKKSGGKGGMMGAPEQKYTEWKYYGNFAIALAEGDGGGAIARVYANNKLIYDATGTSGTFNKYKDCGVRLYMGAADQRVDPLIEADKGTGNSPAYRGLMMVVFEHMPLLDFGNRLPSIEIEADSEAEAASTSEPTIGYTPQADGWFDMRMQPTSRKIYFCKHGYFGGSGTIMGIVDMETNTLLAYETAVAKSDNPGAADGFSPELVPGFYGLADGFDPKVMLPYEDGKLFAYGRFDAGTVIVKLNPTTLEGISYSKDTLPEVGIHGEAQPIMACSFTRKHLTGGVHNYSLLQFNGWDPDPPTTLWDTQLRLWDRDDELWGPVIHLGSEGGVASTRPSHNINGEYLQLHGMAIDRDGYVYYIEYDPEAQWQAAQSLQFDYLDPTTGWGAYLIRVDVKRTMDTTLYGVDLLGQGPEMEYKRYNLSSLCHRARLIYDSSSHSLILMGGPFNSPVMDLPTTVTPTTSTLTRSVGSWLSDGFIPQSDVTISGAGTPANNSTFTIADVTATVLTTVEALTPEGAQSDLVVTMNLADHGNYNWVKWDIATQTATVTVTRNRYTDPGRDLYATSVGMTMWGLGTNNGNFYFMNADVDPPTTVPGVYKVTCSDLSAEEVQGPSEAVDAAPANPYAMWEQNLMLWDPVFNQIWYAEYGSSGGTNYMERVQYDRVSLQPVPLTEVLSDLIDITDLDSSTDLDVTDTGLVGQEVRGYLVGRRMSVRGATHPLAVPYQWDMVESESKLKVVSRGGASARTIAEDDLAASPVRGGGGGSQGEKLIIDRSQEYEVPYRFDLTYIDPDRAYQEGNQSDQRHTVPNPTMRGRDVAQLQIALVLTDDEAAQAAEMSLTGAWVSRTGYELALGPKHMDLEPTDVITVLRDTVPYVMRLTKQEVGEAFVSQLRASSDDAEVYESSLIGASALTSVQVLGSPGGTVLFILDIPLMRDEDDTMGLASGAYVGYGPYLAAWRGAVAEVSLDGGSSWERYSSSRGASIWGYLVGDVAELDYDADQTWPAEVNTIDETTTITVQIVSGGDDLEDITRNELFTTMNNIMVIGEGASAEVVKFQNVTDNADTTYDFDVLLRGRRGTEEAAMAGHAASTRVVFLSEGVTNREGMALGLIDQAHLYRATSIGEITETAALINYTHEGNDLKPYAVCEVEVDDPYDGAARGALIFTWTHRTRTGGQKDLADGIQAEEVALAELTESYEVDLLGVAYTGVDSTSDIDAANDDIAVATHPWETGDGPVQVAVESGLLPGGLARNTNYWVIDVSANEISLATTQTNALAEVAIDLTDAVGTFSITTGAAVTKTSASDATGVTFTLTDIVTTAGYTDGERVHIVIYQLSDAVGRGYPRAITL